MEKIRICVLFRIRIKIIFLSKQFSLSLSLLQFSATPLPQFFFPSISANPLPLFFKKKFLPRILATWLPKFFFPPIFSNLVATIHIFSLLLLYNFGNLVVTIHIPFRALHLAQHMGHFTGELGAARISVILLLKFNFFSLLHHITYFFFLSLILFLAISAMVLLKFTLFPHFSK